MRLLIQRVSRAEVRVEEKTVGRIERGFLVLCGFRKNDKAESLRKLAEKCVNLRVFEDKDGKMNLSLLEIGGELLVVSQFTLYADCRKGRRPGFDSSMPPQEAESFYNNLITEFKKSGLKVESGLFGAKMQIELVNHGPVTIMLDDHEV
jgi:D-aminoacyl-tRNA deacylase